jgi:uncharacterized protein YgfB (UPF0149 family)
MASSPTLPEYDELEDELRALDAVNAAEAHGVLAGIASAVATPAGAGIRIVLGDVDAGSDSTRAKALLEDVGSYTEGRLAARESDFELLLPHDAEPLAARIGALADFCRGYVMGLVAGGVREFAALPGDAREVVEDFMKIADTEVPESITQAEEQALAELAEYVRTGVQVVYEELRSGD